MAGSAAFGRTHTGYHKCLMICSSSRSSDELLFVLSSLTELERKGAGARQQRVCRRHHDLHVQVPADPLHTYS